jgi:HEAT repeat protein
MSHFLRAIQPQRRSCQGEVSQRNAILIGLVFATAPVWAAFQAQPATSTVANNARAVLTQGASDKDPETRREVAVALSLISSKEQASALLESLARDKDHSVRRAAADSIGELGAGTLAKVVVPMLDDDVPEVVFAAARSLFRLNDPEGKRVLMAIVEKEEKAQSSAVRGKMRDVLRKMKTPKSAFFFMVQQGAGFIPVPGMGAGFSAISSMLGDADFSPRATALLLMANDNSKELRTAAEEAFDDSEWSVRAAAIQLTALRSETRWRPHLIRLIDDTNRKVRFRAAAVYLRLNYVRVRSPQSGIR